MTTTTTRAATPEAPHNGGPTMKKTNPFRETADGAMAAGAVTLLDDFCRRLAAGLQARREGAGLSQQELDALCGFKRTAHIEAGYPTTTRSLARLADALALPRVDALWDSAPVRAGRYTVAGSLEMPGGDRTVWLVPEGGGAVSEVAWTGEGELPRIGDTLERVREERTLWRPV